MTWLSRWNYDWCDLLYLLASAPVDQTFVPNNHSGKQKINLTNDTLLLISLSDLQEFIMEHDDLGLSFVWSSIFIEALHHTCRSSPRKSDPGGPKYTILDWQATAAANYNTTSETRGLIGFPVFAQCLQKKDCSNKGTGDNRKRFLSASVMGSLKMLEKVAVLLWDGFINSIMCWKAYATIIVLWERVWIVVVHLQNMYLHAVEYRANIFHIAPSDYSFL